jgi:hypothetical protein
MLRKSWFSGTDVVVNRYNLLLFTIWCPNIYNLCVMVFFTKTHKLICLFTISNMVPCYLQLSCVVFFTQAQTIQHCHAPFDDQLVRLYTRKVYLEYRQVFNKSTTFRMDQNPSVPHGFLVKHQRSGGVGVGSVD